MASEKIYFDHIYEKNDDHFLEYSPPSAARCFASLAVTYISDFTDEGVAEDLENLSKK